MDFLRKMYGSALQRAVQLEVPHGPVPEVRPFGQALHDMALIAEVKYATPADGFLGITDGPEAIAREYERLGAAAVSCLTEPEYFAGSLEYITRIRSACSLPVMMKDSSPTSGSWRRAGARGGRLPPHHRDAGPRRAQGAVCLRP
jgi:indole-3-glycerol phosphate synthase